MSSTPRQWVLKGRGSFDKLELEENVAEPEVGENEVLVNSERRPDRPQSHSFTSLIIPVKAASLNFRDIAIVRVRRVDPPISLAR